ncbi:related to bifunctional polynucleotide phosphatase/kinase [Sporisorium reilianum f. sp. reilianum]|uniref:Related to bifunctional polynucleotide phosphatase/kinase n=1 Tax=Sporisorium reilianum f. sp. reilianum TaxID=72559 RepID=A0A2N8UC65_9BASI|nr:related to bifunctional polynucleotide phosphatase/kinase [Sporisorium reilianum f. sp. reilianum]
MKRTLAQQDGLAKAKRSKDESDDDDEPVLPVRAPVLKKASTSADKPTPELASIFQPRSTASTSTSTNGASSSKGLKWLDPIGPSKTCLHGVYGDPPPSSKVAFYDLDGTIVRPKNGKTFPSKTDEYDFEFLFSSPRSGTLSVIQRIREQHEQGFAVVIITNQKQTAYSAKSGLATWKKKMAHIAAAIDVPMRVLAALGDDEFRKPRLGMWQEFLKRNGGVEVDLQHSFFVGDAAGRKKYRDHQDTDLKWALNAGLPFFTPEEYFLAKPKEYEIPTRPWSPSSHGMANGTLKGLVAEPEDEMVTVELSALDTDDSVARTILGDASDPEIVLFVGPPASGKTFLYNRTFARASYVHVNQDTLRTRDKCLRVVSDTIAAHGSCVVDNTNRDAKTRALYIDLARTLGVRVRCIYFDVPKHVCVHNNHFRAHHGPVGDEARRGLLPYTAIEGWFKERSVPRKAEGFSADVVRVVWGWSGADEVRERWRMYYH